MLELKTLHPHRLNSVGMGAIYAPSMRQVIHGLYFLAIVSALLIAFLL